MASSGKRKTTMAKLNRERKLRERRMEKQVRKNARKQASAERSEALESGEFLDDELLPGQIGEPVAQEEDVQPGSEPGRPSSPAA